MLWGCDTKIVKGGPTLVIGDLTVEYDHIEFRGPLYSPLSPALVSLLLVLNSLGEE